MLAMQYVGSAVIMAALIDEEEEDKQRRRHRFWIHPVIAQREGRGQFWVPYNDLHAHEDKFFNYTQMSIRSFDELLALLFSVLDRQNTHFRKSILDFERLITLRYLATGHSFASLHFEFLVDKTTASNIVHDTCRDIWNVIRDLALKKLTPKDWCKIAEVFWDRCNFPNCVRAIDGKHIRVVMPIVSGIKFFNYTKYFSFVLLAVADGNYCFRYIDIRLYGSSSDSSIFA
ncbi:uncharacterized protein LOC143926991 [Lithobates pipiens]